MKSNLIRVRSLTSFYGSLWTKFYLEKSVNFDDLNDYSNAIRFQHIYILKEHGILFSLFQKQYYIEVNFSKNVQICPERPNFTVGRR